MINYSKSELFHLYMEKRLNSDMALKLFLDSRVFVSDEICNVNWIPYLTFTSLDGKTPVYKGKKSFLSVKTITRYSHGTFTSYLEETIDIQKVCAEAHSELLTSRIDWEDLPVCIVIPDYQLNIPIGYVYAGLSKESDKIVFSDIEYYKHFPKGTVRLKEPTVHTK